MTILLFPLCYTLIMYYVYIIECADGSLYTGITTNLERRLDEHKNGIGSKYTRARGVKKILYSKRKRTRATALKLEAEIKNMKREDKLKFIKNA